MVINDVAGLVEKINGTTLEENMTVLNRIIQRSKEQSFITGYCAAEDVLYQRVLAYMQKSLGISDDAVREVELHPGMKNISVQNVVEAKRVALGLKGFNLQSLDYLKGNKDLLKVACSFIVACSKQRAQFLLRGLDSNGMDISEIKDPLEFEVEYAGKPYSLDLRTSEEVGRECASSLDRLCDIYLAEMK
jgi:hypothetical protein